MCHRQRRYVSRQRRSADKGPHTIHGFTRVAHCAFAPEENPHLFRFDIRFNFFSSPHLSLRSLLGIVASENIKLLSSNILAVIETAQSEYFITSADANSTVESVWLIQISRNNKLYVMFMLRN